MRKLVFTALLFTLIAGAGSLKAQDPIFSQFYNNPIYYNPGYIGLNSGFRARFNYRDQWTGIPEDFKTYNFSLDVAERALPDQVDWVCWCYPTRQAPGLSRPTM